MATNIPPHNLTEVVNAAIEMVNNPNAGLAEVLKHVKGPDFPTGGFLYGRSGIAQAYSTGRGRFLMRARCAIENMNQGRQAIIVSEIPYQVNKNTLIKRIAELVNEKVIDEISDVRDESDRDGMRIVIELKRGAEPQIVLNQLYKHSQMQESFSMIFLAVVNGQPRELPLHDAIRHFLDHRIDVVRRRTAFCCARRASASTSCSATRSRSIISTTSSRSFVGHLPARMHARTSSSSFLERRSPYAIRHSPASRSIQHATPSTRQRSSRRP